MHSAMALVTKGFLCPTVEQVVQQVAISPGDGQALLKKALELPLPSSMTEAKGITQSDIILRTALVMAIADLRANPWLLEHVFASLLDDVTARDYGEKERRRAVEWFLKTDIPVVMDFKAEAPEGVMLSVSLADSVETEATLGDVHYETSEAAEAAWPPLTPAFTPVAYSPATGTVQLPAGIAAALVVAPGMVLLDRVGRAYPVTDVLSRTAFTIAPGTVADLTNAVLKGAQPRLTRAIESLSFKETYRVGCHAHGEAHYLLWLHAIVVFCLLRYKQVLLEARGVERTTYASGPFAKNEALGAEKYYSRFVTVTGYVRQYWPKAVADRVLATTVDPLLVSKVGEAATAFVAEPGSTDPAWLAQDGTGTRL